MNNIAIASKGTGREARVVTLPKNYVSMLRAEQNYVSMLRGEVELMIHEDTYLRKIVGAAALLVARLDRAPLHGKTATAAFILAGLIDGMPEDMVSEAVSLLKSS